MPISMKFPQTTTAANINWQDSETIDAIKQNLRVLILTIPGEYQHDIEYGVGIRQHLFEPKTPQLLEEIRNRILDQARRYMTYIAISDITFLEDERSPNQLGIRISYYIKETTVLQEFELYESTADEEYFVY